ncbi:unnamed protein product [Closterium sp. NIES-53]
MAVPAKAAAAAAERVSDPCCWAARACGGATACARSTLLTLPYHPSSRVAACSSSHLPPSPRLPPSPCLPPSFGLRRQQSAAAALASTAPCVLYAAQRQSERQVYLTAGAGKEGRGAHEERRRPVVVYQKSSSTGSGSGGGGTSGTSTSNATSCGSGRGSSNMPSSQSGSAAAQPKRIAHSMTYHPGGNTKTSLATVGSSSNSSSSGSSSNNNSNSSTHCRTSPSSSTCRPSPPLPLSPPPPPASLVPLLSPLFLTHCPLLSLSFSASASPSALAKPRPLSRANSAALALLHPQPILLAGGKRFSTRSPSAAAAAAAAAAVAANGGGASAAAAAAATNGAGAVTAPNNSAAAATGKAREMRATEAAATAGGKGAMGLKASEVVYHPPFSSYRHQADVAAQEEEASLRELEQQLERERRRREEEDEEDLLAVAGERRVREVRARESEWEEGGAWIVKMPGRGESRRLEELCEKLVGMGAARVGMGLDGVEMCLELERGVVSIGPSVGGRGGMGRSLSMEMGSSPEAMPDARGRERVGVMQGGREHAVTSPAPVPPPMRRSHTDTKQERREREQQEQMGACVK